MKILKFLFLIMFLSLSVSLYSMPPHPDVVAEYQKNGQLESLMNRVESLNKMTDTDSPLKSFPVAGAMRVPVLLVNYAVPYQASSELIFYKRIFNRDNMPLPGLLVLLTAALFLFFKNYSRLSTGYLRPVIPAYLSIFIIALSCGVTPDDDGGGFSTDTSVYSRILNGSTLSVRKYYQDMSRNNLNLTFDIYGPVTVSKSWDYYGENDSVTGYDLRPRELVSEALRLLVSKYPSVDFKIYDNDNDTFIDAVIIIHQGPGEEVKTFIKSLIWSHQWELSSPVSTGDGVSFKVYTIQPEYTHNPGDSSMGVFAHEFGHVLGLPDLYDTENATDGVGIWSLMSAGAWMGPAGASDGTTPAPLLAWERFKLGGTDWVTITTVSADSSNISIDDIEASPGAVFKVSLDAGTDQYLLIEGKVQSSSAGWYVPGTGILISHIHGNVISNYSSTNKVNAGLTRVHGVNIIEADGAGDLWVPLGDRGAAGDLYTSGSYTADKYDSESIDSAVPAGVVVYNISVTTGPLVMKFDVNVP
jgi:M6 family metalloprotease-like protein